MAEHTAHRHIQIKHPGALTAKARAAGVSLSRFEQMPHSDPETRKQVQFALNAKKWHHHDGKTR
jgi:hypothetical protein